jgi:hypothetical protein
MRIFKITDNLGIVRGSKEAEPRYRKEISSFIIDRFGKGPFTPETVKEILIFCQDYYIKQFEKVCQNERSYTFYKTILKWHEQAAQIRRSEHFQKLPDGLDKRYFSGYRRILKMILEQGCLINMVSGEKEDADFRKRISLLMDDLLYLGQMIYEFGESVAEQDMIEDISDITFDANDLYLQRRRHHYDFIFEHIAKEAEKSRDEFVIDKNALADFNTALQGSFGIDYDKIVELLHRLFIHLQLEPGDCLSANKENFLKDATNHTGVAEDMLKKFFAGLTINRDNKMPISELVRRPHSINRYLYRPLLQWTVNDKPFYVMGLFGWDEAQNGLLLNSIPWGKFPTEWEGNSTFKTYVDRKRDEHDKWLDDEVEEIIVSESLRYDRGVEKLSTAKVSYSLVKLGIGEIDFLVICPAIKKVLVTECKHLLGRYDMVNWKNDHDHFTVDGKTKSYNNRLKCKVDWLLQHKKILEEHFQLKYNDATFSLEDYAIEGIFIINTPTFYMYNSRFRIYTYHHLKDIVTGVYVDPTFSLLVEGDDYTASYFVKHPYLQKPKMLYYEVEDEDCEVDKYGFPIKKNSPGES